MSQPEPESQPSILTSPEFLENPYAIYAMLRENQPILRLPLDDVSSAGTWILTRYDDVRAVLGDSRVSSDRLKAEALKLQLEADPDIRVDPEQRSMLMVDPPDHTRLRSVVNRVFTPRRVAELRPRIEAAVDGMLDGARTGSGMDVMHVLARPLPVIVIAELLGIPTADHRRLKELSTRLLVTIEGIEVTKAQRRDAEAAGDELNGLIGAVIRDRDKEPQDDLISALLIDQKRERTLTLKELLSTLGLILIAGHETTTNLIGNGIHALLRNPEQLASLAADPSGIECAVEEMLRFDPPIQLTSRVATEEMTMRGQTFEPGAMLLVTLASANRDPEHFADPESFDIARDPNPHLSFAHGLHFCLGSHLARLEGAVATRQLLRRFPKLELVEDEVVRRATPLLRGFERLPVRF